MVNKADGAILQDYNNKTTNHQSQRQGLHLLKRPFQKNTSINMPVQGPHTRLATTDFLQEREKVHTLNDSILCAGVSRNPMHIILCM